MANVPTVSWSETTPAGSDQINAGDNRIREMKTQIREVIAVDHDFPSSGQASDVGQHLRCTFQEQADLGTGTVGTTILGNQTVSGKGELVYTDEDDNDIQITDNGFLRGASLLDSGALQSSALKQAIFNFIYPIGSVITLGVSTNPNTLFGFGTWSQIKGRVIVGLDPDQAEFDTLDETGGQKTVDHTHSVSGTCSVSGTLRPGSGASGVGMNSVTGNIEPQTFSVTSGSASDTENLQPYIVKYVWQRIA